MSVSRPGNVRELRNALEHATVVSGGGPILPAHLPEGVRTGRSELRGAAPEAEALLRSYLDMATVGEDLHRRVMEPVERELLGRVLRECGGNQSLAAQRLGMHRNTLRRKLREFGLAEQG